MRRPEALIHSNTSFLYVFARHNISASSPAGLGMDSPSLTIKVSGGHSFPLRGCAAELV
jgi:hypothetical protein